MPQYEIEIEITANRVKELVFEHPSDALDAAPSLHLDKMMKQLGKTVRQMNPGRTRMQLPQAGLALRKMVTVHVESFAALAELLGKFDAFAEQLEIESQVKHS